MTQDVNLESSPDEENRIPHSRVAEMVQEAAEKATREAELRLQAERSQDREAIAKLEGQIQALSQTKEAPRPQFTEDQLQQFVDEGKLTQAQATAELVRQKTEVLEQKFEKRLEQFSVETQTSAAHSAEMSRYLEEHPELATPGSEDRTALNARYAALMSDGHPSGTKTELLALELCFGKPGTKPKVVTREARDVSEETHGSGGESGEEVTSDAKAKATKNMSPSQKAHYEKRVEQGFYKGWSDPQLQREAKYVKAKK